MTRAVLGLVAVAACHHGAAAPPPAIANTGTAPELPPAHVSGMRDGALWTCRIDDYDDQPCKLTREPDGWHLTKLLGSQRFTGAVMFAGDATRLFGRFFCPWGDCDADLDVRFTKDEHGYTGQMPSGPTVPGAMLNFRYDAANDEAFAGAGYGGLTGLEQ